MNIQLTNAQQGFKIKIVFMVIKQQTEKHMCLIVLSYLTGTYVAGWDAWLSKTVDTCNIISI